MRQLEDGVEAKKGQSPNTEVRSSLKHEILDLQDRLQDQVLVRRALEKALNLRPFPHDIMTDESIPRPAKELVKEIAVLELEVVYLERYLLSLYRKTFEQQVSSLSTKDERVDERFKMSSTARKGMFPSVPGNENDVMSDKDHSADNASHLSSLTKECNGTWGPAKLLDSSIHRCHSSMSQRSIGTSPATRLIARAVDSCHSLPLSMLELSRNDTSNAISLADHLGTSTRYDVLETPNWLSEEMIRRISTVFCELGGPPLINPDNVPSPISISSSPHEFSSQGHGDALSPQVQRICRDTQKLRYIQQKLQDFRSLVSRLEGVDPRKMKHDEKLAFWINVHNALVMHAYIVYGIPQSSMKRMSLILKAAYNVGGQTVNVEMIQNSILGCRLLRPGPWLRQLFSWKTKFKNGDGRRAYSIDHPEPRLYFALCAGSYSDPAVRAYTPKRVYEDLEAAKEEYIQSTFIVNKEKKLLLSKIVESFAKDSELCPAGLVEMIEHLLPDYMKRRIRECQHRKFGKKIEWIPHNFSFRYLLSKELA
ncbi:TERNARY COMPLEX FACTOR MIP1 LEUCINE-ZIPPER PROTEIN [Salix viminalis]|uniref:TERNARY COMPLEX FACTOR MIP1 LEUCINE-ZIPPER PROTEIN n=1 Tax=Salix viminalis TaxID=40686 RepID=A0A9Q0QJJ4_SALVM|nr:TERNARY COMPLEX FACTOR MIP1 LEUCINE-ZIPPER PROTEIN [Salix viminalis]